MLAHRAEKALFDLLPWDRFAADGVLRNVDGALTAFYRFRGPDLASATTAELEGLSNAVVRALRPLGDGWIVLFDLFRVPAARYPALGAFPDPFTRELDDDRRQAWERVGEHYRSVQVIAFTWHPGSLDEPAALEDVATRVGEVTSVLGAVLRLERLGTCEAANHLYRCLTGRLHRINVPTHHAVSLEALLAAGDLHAGTELRFAETHLVPIAIAGFPESVSPGTFDFLHELGFPLRATFRFLPFDPATGRKAIERARSRWSTAGIRLKDVLAMLTGGVTQKPTFGDRVAPALAQDADDALFVLEREQMPFGQLTPVITVAAEDRALALQRAGLILKELRNRGFGAWIEETNALEAYLGTLPGEGRSNVRRPIVSLRALVDLAPVTSVWAGPERHPHPRLRQHSPHVVVSTTGSTPFALNLSAQDVMHTLIVGPTGSGKSVLLNLLLAQWFRYPDAQVFSFDKGRSQQALVQAAGGEHYDLAIGGEAGAHFSPLAHLDTPQDFQRAHDWLHDLLAAAGQEVGPAERASLAKALRHLAESETRTLTNLAVKLQDRDLRRALEPYTIGGAYAELFDAERSPIRESRFQVFEMESVLPLKRRVVAPLVIHLFAELERRLDGRPTLLAIEEVAGYLHDTLFAERFQAWVLELRKKNTGVVFVAQNLTTFLESSLRNVLLENAPTRIYLPNPAAREPAVADAYRAFGLNERQIETLATATPKRDYYLVSPDGCRVFTLDLGKKALGVLGRVESER
ncbi:MAG: conjugal transfer protein TrbE [Thermoanaerobaculia bacterium]|nr:conjugal transfer protein TrbE [Thermoanaerobaculia bacterium]